MEIFIDCEEELRGDKIKDGRKTKGYFAQDEVPQSRRHNLEPWRPSRKPTFLSDSWAVPGPQLSILSYLSELFV